MGEYNEHAKQTGLYELIGAETRFVRLANIILERIGETPDGETTTRVATWPQNPKGESYRLRMATFNTGMSTPTFIYALDHFVESYAAHYPLTRYQVSVTGTRINPVMILDAHNAAKLHNDQAKRLALRHMLGALTDIAPKEAKEILTSVFEERFESLVGCYVLSAIAIEGVDEEISEYAAWAETEDFEMRITEIEDEVLDGSLNNDSEAKQEAILEAITTRRPKTNKNNYAPIDIVAATEKVAKEIGKKWRYTVTPDQ